MVAALASATSVSSRRLCVIADPAENRTAVTLSFARAKRPQLPATAGQARSRERPSPADIVYLKYAFFGSHVCGEMLFSAWEYQAKGYLGSIVRVGSGTEWAADAVCEDTPQCGA